MAPITLDGVKEEQEHEHRTSKFDVENWKFEIPFLSITQNVVHLTNLEKHQNKKSWMRRNWILVKSCHFTVSLGLQLQLYIERHLNMILSKVRVLWYKKSFFFLIVKSVFCNKVANPKGLINVMAFQHAINYLKLYPPARKYHRVTVISSSRDVVQPKATRSLQEQP